MNEPMALYMQIAESLRERIMSGRFKPGSSIGTQEELTKEHKISRVTLRHALKLLEQQGLIKTIQGKGSYVIGTPLSQELSRLVSMSEVVQARGLSHKIEISRFEWVIPPKPIEEFFRIGHNNPVLLIERVHIVNSYPAAVAVIYVPADIGVRITKEELETSSLYAVMEDKLGIMPGDAIQQIGATAANEHLVGMLKVPIGFPLLTAERKTLSSIGSPIEHISFYYNSDTYRFTVELSRAEALPMVVPSFPKGKAGGIEGKRSPIQWSASMQLKKVPGDD